MASFESRELRSLRIENYGVMGLSFKIRILLEGRACTGLRAPFALLNLLESRFSKVVKDCLLVGSRLGIFVGSLFLNLQVFWLFL